LGPVDVICIRRDLRACVREIGAWGCVCRGGSEALGGSAGWGLGLGLGFAEEGRGDGGSPWGRGGEGGGGDGGGRRGGSGVAS
jgi:hypothetical protein